MVIDESHNFRNANPVRGKETRYDFLMNKIIKDGVNTKVLMLSATPVNNRYNDLKNQIALAYCGDFTKLDESIDTTKSVATIFSNALRVGKHIVLQNHPKPLFHYCTTYVWTIGSFSGIIYANKPIS